MVPDRCAGRERDRARALARERERSETKIDGERDRHRYREGDPHRGSDGVSMRAANPRSCSASRHALTTTRTMPMIAIPWSCARRRHHDARTMTSLERVRLRTPECQREGPPTLGTWCPRWTHRCGLTKSCRERPRRSESLRVGWFPIDAHGEQEIEERDRYRDGERDRDRGRDPHRGSDGVSMRAANPRSSSASRDAFTTMRTMPIMASRREWHDSWCHSTCAESTGRGVDTRERTGCITTRER